MSRKVYVVTKRCEGDIYVDTSIFTSKEAAVEHVFGLAQEYVLLNDYKPDASRYIEQLCDEHDKFKNMDNPSELLYEYECTKCRDRYLQSIEDSGRFDLNGKVSVCLSEDSIDLESDLCFSMRTSSYDWYRKGIRQCSYRQCVDIHVSVDVPMSVWNVVTVDVPVSIEQ